uniref:TRP C-terminal domain-containing protein n=1 Tax=Amphimedon queenslandica TaxID=400682 RepID=A0A1X7TD50_AMPQE
MMSPGVVLVSLLSLVLVYSAAGLECRIYVSSSHGINNTSCWTGGVQTPCATIDLAIQGTATLQYNCSSGILINLSPGTYTLDTTSLLEQQLLRNNVSIIGMRDGSRYEEVSITCLHVSSSSYNWLKYIVFDCISLYNCNNVPVTCTEPSFDITTHNEPVLGDEVCPNFELYLDEYINITLLCFDFYINENCQCDYLSFYAYITDTCTFQPLDWEYGLNACFSFESSTYQDCYPVSPQPNEYGPNGSLYYQVTKCFDFIESGSIEVTLYIYILNVHVNKTINITTECYSGNCTQSNCDTDDLPYKLPCFGSNYNSFGRCYDNNTKECYIYCPSELGIPLNNPYTCVKCDEHGLLVFIVIELLPITIMVLLIIIFNIQLTNGSINGLVFYSQIIALSYFVYYYYIYYDYSFDYDPYRYVQLSVIPCNIFNLDFTPFIYNYVMCISPNTPPLGVISFWYVIGFYPLLLLLLLYVWITLYDKGYKCVVFITRPFHRCMARFWSMTGIEPSFTHSIASIYILCFTQLAATSFKILSINLNSISTLKFYYDMNQDYFKGVHGAAGFFAVLVLMLLIVLPTLYILLYRFKWFHKLLDCLHLRKQLLISLGDVFTGPYKNGTENTYDYRFMAGLYLLARIIILGFYPLLLLLLLYVWITLYDKGYKCVVFITRPFHHCMARFWSMAGIEPSFTHSIASIYILCFTQLAATSFKILSVAPKNETLGFNNTKFYYDMKQDYFKGVHGTAGFFAILVLLFLIVLPTLYILLYPFQWFHKLLDCLHLRKQLLISLGDVFTGPYKNGTENTYDYRFMAGLYLLARIIILSQFSYGHYFIFSIPISQACCSFLLAVILIIFRPFQKNIHNFTEFLIFFLAMAIGCTNSGISFLISRSAYPDVGFDISFRVLKDVLPTINGLFFGIIIPGYIIYQIYKMIKSCYRYHKKKNPVANQYQDNDYQPLVGNDGNWIADRMENPQEYDEQHVPGRMDDVSEEDQQPITIATAATYSSINEAATV